MLTQDTFDALKNGDQRAFLTIYEGYRDAVYIASYNMLKVEEEAEDVTMKAFFTLWKERDELSEPSHLRNYLFLVARNACLDILKMNQRRNNLYKEYQQSSIGLTGSLEQLHEKERIHADLLAQLFHAIKHLPEKTREVFILRYYVGKSADEVANLMGISIKAVYNQSQDATKSLRRQLTPHLPELAFLVLLGLLIHR